MREIYPWSYLEHVSGEADTQGVVACKPQDKMVLAPFYHADLHKRSSSNAGFIWRLHVPSLQAGVQISQRIYTVDGVDVSKMTKLELLKGELLRCAAKTAAEGCSACPNCHTEWVHVHVHVVLADVTDDVVVLELSAILVSMGQPEDQTPGAQPSEHTVALNRSSCPSCPSCSSSPSSPSSPSSSISPSCPSSSASRGHHL